MSSAGKYERKFIRRHRIAVGTCASSRRRTIASRFLLVPSTRVRARSDRGHFQRAKNPSGNSKPSLYTARQLMSLAWSQVGVISLQALNHFQRYAYVRQAYARECRAKEGGSSKESGSSANHLVPPPPPASRTPSNRSEISLGAF